MGTFIHRERESERHLPSDCYMLNLPAKRSAQGSDCRKSAHFPLEMFNSIICELLKSYHFGFRNDSDVYFLVKEQGERRTTPQAVVNVLNLFLKGYIPMPACTSGLETLPSKVTP